MVRPPPPTRNAHSASSVLDHECRKRGCPARGMWRPSNGRALLRKDCEVNSLAGPPGGACLHPRPRPPARAHRPAHATHTAQHLRSAAAPVGSRGELRGACTQRAGGSGGGGSGTGGAHLLQRIHVSTRPHALAQLLHERSRATERSENLGSRQSPQTTTWGVQQPIAVNSLGHAVAASWAQRRRQQAGGVHTRHTMAPTTSSTPHVAAPSMMAYTATRASTPTAAASLRRRARGRARIGNTTGGGEHLRHDGGPLSWPRHPAGAVPHTVRVRLNA
jgi:hypothetical protein